MSRLKILISVCDDDDEKTAIAGRKNSSVCDYLISLSSVRVRWLHFNVFLYYIILVFLTAIPHLAIAYPNQLDKTELFLDKVNLEQSIAAVFNKVAYGSTTKRSIPDNAYPATTLATPLLTTFRYSDGKDEWLRVDVKKPAESGRSSSVDFEQPDEKNNYGMDLEKDHALPTSAPAADILKNNNNKNYNNPNRYNNDRLRPDYKNNPDEVTENVIIKTTTTAYAGGGGGGGGNLKNVRPTKSMYKDVPSYVPPSRILFTPPLPPEFVNPFADKPTLRGTNSDNFGNRRPIPPPSLMPNKDRIPFRPDLPPSKAVNVERIAEKLPNPDSNIRNLTTQQQQQQQQLENDKRKMLNTPSRNGQFYGGNNRNMSESNFEYDAGYVPTITRILSGSNGRQDELPDILLRTVTATPNVHRSEMKTTTKTAQQQQQHKIVIEPNQQQEEKIEEKTETEPIQTDESTSKMKKEIVVPNEPKNSIFLGKDEQQQQDVPTTQISDVQNLQNVKYKERNVTKASSDDIWFICWNVHVYLVVFGYILLALYSIYKLIRYENDPHMFSKSYFLTIHLMLTVICVLRIFYLVYDPYNLNKSFNTFLYDFLHSFPLSLLATTFAVLILFLLKRTLTHLEVKTRPVFLVVFGLLHILLCFCLSILETLGQFPHASLIVSKPVFILLAWALGFSYLYLYRIIKNVLAKKSQNLSEVCTQNISYASHITIAVALLFVLLGFVQLYALFFIKIDRFNGETKHYWILWGFELSVRFLEISIITLLAIVVSLKMSQREKQTVGFPLFPCAATSDSSTDNIYPNNCNTNPNAMNYSRNEMMMMENIPTEPVERPNLLRNSFQNESFDNNKKLPPPTTTTTSTLERDASERCFERPKWGSGHFDANLNGSRNNAERGSSARKYYTKPKYDNDELFHQEQQQQQQQHNNVYSEPIDNNHYERTRHEFERGGSSRNSNTSGRRTSTGRTRKNHARPHLGGVQTLPAHQLPDSMLVDDQGFVRFRHMQDEMHQHHVKKIKKQSNDFSDA